MTEKVQIKAIVSGRVQGVFFRVSTKDAAIRLGVNGYVKNLPNGSVEAVFEGKNSMVSKILEWCKKGPAGAIVEDVIAENLESLSDYSDFEVRY